MKKREAENLTKEKSINPTTGKEYYTHRKLMAAYKSYEEIYPIFLPIQTILNSTL